MSGRLSLPRWTNHPALRAFGFVFLLRDLVLAAVAIGGLVTGMLADQDTLSVVAVGLGTVALAGVVASSIAGQRRADPLDAGHHLRAGLYVDEAPAPPRVPETNEESPRAASALREPLHEQSPAEVAFHTAVANQVTSAKKLRTEMRDAQEQGVWDDEGWAYRKRVEMWTERTANVLAGCGRDDLASALSVVEAPPRPPFESILKGYSPSYARLIGLLDGRIGLLEESQG